MRLIIFTCCYLLLFTTANAVTSLPYYTGFDDATQQMGWTTFRKGFPSMSQWGYGMNSAYTVPYTLYHDFPVDAPTMMDTCTDWYVSPAFNFASGAMIDSLEVRVFSIMGSVSPAAQLAVYILQGSNDPAMATSITEIADLTGFIANNGMWNNTGSYMIPPKSGTCYLAFKYRATSADWFVVDVDNIAIRSLTTGINETETPGNIKVSLNSSQSLLRIILENENKNTEAVILRNASGQQVYSQNCRNKSTIPLLDVSPLKSGIYFATVRTTEGIEYTRKFSITR